MAKNHDKEAEQKSESVEIEVAEENGLSLEQRRIAESKKSVLVALEASFGIVSTACKTANISRQTFYRWMQEDEVFKAMVESMQEYTLDFVESHLLKRIKEGSDAAIIFYMKTKGKKRGFIEKAPEGNDGNQDKITRPAFKLPDGTTIEL